jgi:hypothetical protein
MQPMHEIPKLPNFDPDYCLKVAKWSALFCVSWLIVEVLILTFVDPSGSTCPGWRLPDGPSTSLWTVVGMFTGAIAIWACVVVFRWDYFGQQMYDGITGTRPPFSISLHLLKKVFKPDPNYVEDIEFWPKQYIHGGWIIGNVFLCLFCASPFWIMLASCTNLPRYLGYHSFL